MKKVEISFVEFNNGINITYSNGECRKYLCYEDSEELYYDLAFSDEFNITNLDDVFYYDENEYGMYVFNLDNKQYFI